MKYLINLTKTVALVAMCSFVFLACKKPKESSPMGDAGQTLVKIINGGTPAGITSSPIDFVPTPTKILAVELRRDIPNNAELNRTMVVTVLDDLAAVTAADPGYIQLPTAWYSLEMDGVKTGGQGGTFTFTFLPGQFSKEIYVIIPDATVLDPSALYGLGFTITSADADGVISTQKSVVVEIGAKNDYDGIYSVESGFVQRYTAPGVPEPLGGLNGDLTGNTDVILFTAGATTVGIPTSAEAGRLEWALTSGHSGVAGVDGIRVTVDPVTNLTTSTCAGNATFSNWAGHANSYDPATKTFNLAFRWNPASTTREYEIELKYKGPR